VTQSEANRVGKGPERNIPPADVIHVLSDSVINQIKAGEVVERPLSVVKELVENALDADADEVTVDIFDGGKAMIRITDTGKGMSPADAVRALCRHATSKITEVDDLDHIATFGFRGEALASIAAVSNFVLRTRRSCDPAATQVQLDSAGKASNKPIASPPGTQIEVGDLFCNVPARQKFLKNAATEYAHIHDFVQSMAFAYPAVSWTLTHNRRRVFCYRAAADLHARAQDILGNGFEDFFPVTFEKGSFGLTGFVSHPSLAKPAPQHFILFVNGRLVRDKVIRSGVLQAYSGLVMKGLVPSVILFVQCDPSWVDVNAHPSKIEVRFRDPLVVQDLICLGLVAELRARVQKSAMPFAPAPVEFNPPSGDFFPSPVSARSSIGTGLLGSTGASSGFVDAMRSAKEVPNAKEMPSARAANFGSSAVSDGVRFQERAARVTDAMDGFAVTANPVRSETNLRAPLRYLGQFNKLYLIFESDQPRELWIVDQHAFHERILFESYIREESGQIARQSFLTPLFVSVPSGVGPLVTENRQTFLKLGFEVEWVESMGKLAIHASPAFIEVTRVERVFDEILVRVLGALDSAFEGDHPLFAKLRLVRSEWSLSGRSFATLDSKDLYHLFYATIACHAAVRAGQELRAEQAQYLIERAKDVDFSAHCPHGRPVLRKLGDAEIASWFGRL
jgi:DNA mismatch repair protein MutL